MEKIFKYYNRKLVNLYGMNINNETKFNEKM
jgi:hypothetical protein